MTYIEALNKSLAKLGLTKKDIPELPESTQIKINDFLGLQKLKTPAVWDRKLGDYKPRTKKKLKYLLRDIIVEIIRFQKSNGQPGAKVEDVLKEESNPNVQQGGTPSGENTEASSAPVKPDGSTSSSDNANEGNQSNSDNANEASNEGNQSNSEDGNHQKPPEPTKKSFWDNIF